MAGMEGVEKLLAELTLEEKVALLAGADSWHTPAIERVGLPALAMTDGPSGARGSFGTFGPRSACFPAGSALAATWDVDLVAEVARHLAEETKAKQAHVLLGPTVNIHRHPLTGRHFECYSEDPELTARIAVAYISALQEQGVAACIKHFIANDQEHERFTVSVEAPERALREIYLRPFEAAVREAGVWSVMAAYNKVAGTWCAEHPGLLNAILRDEWGFDGFVVSDWGATHTTVEATNAGLDVEMPGPTRHRGDALVDAVKAGHVSPETIEERARNVLVTMARTGALDAEPQEETSADTPERRALARTTAERAIVLLRNEGLLPLAAGDVRKVAVIGPNADPARIQGGGSAGVTPYYAISPLDGIRARLQAEPGTTEVVYEPGCSIARTVPRVDLRLFQAADGEAVALTAEHFDNIEFAGEPADRHPVRGIPAGFPSPGGNDRERGVRVRGTLTLPTGLAGTHTFQIRSTGRGRLRIDGDVVAEGWEADTPTGQRAEGNVSLTAGEHEFEVELAFAGGRAGFDVRHLPPAPDDQFDRAVAAARGADVAVVVVGTDSDWETEGRDRTSLSLPGRQDELVDAVLAANPNTVVVVNAGSPVAMPWVERARAVVQLWFCGQECGNALAGILFGDHNPSGRLPTTWPRRIEDTPAFTAYPGDAGVVHYGEGVFCGYRWYEARDIEPLFPFGHGLSYTTFAYGRLRTNVNGHEVAVSVDVTNTGAVAGAEVVQLYVADRDASVARPPKELKAFARVHLEPGETRPVEFTLGWRAFAFWDPSAAGWRIEAGEFELLAGASSADIRARTTIALHAGFQPSRPDTQ